MNGEHHDREALLKEEAETRRAIQRELAAFSRYVPREQAGKDAYRRACKTDGCNNLTATEEFECWLKSY